MGKFRWFLLIAVVFVNKNIMASDTPQKTEYVDEVLIQIPDKYNEVTLGLTKTSVFIIFSQKTIDYMNKELTNHYNLETNLFLDSGGDFVPGSYSLLKSDKLEYLLSDIDTIEFNNGRLEFLYAKQKTFTFEDVLNTNGSQALKNFYLEDLERFYLKYKILVS